MRFSLLTLFVWSTSLSLALGLGLWIGNARGWHAGYMEGWESAPTFDENHPRLAPVLHYRPRVQQTSPASPNL
jgi:hypothetical protein